jgi:hypothetical protein
MAIEWENYMISYGKTIGNKPWETNMEKMNMLKFEWDFLGRNMEKL